MIATGKPIVQLRDVRKTYIMGHHATRGGPKETITVHALRGVDMTVMQGEYVAIMGQSGSGKSTMLNLLGCLDRPTGGEYWLGPRDVAQLSDDELSEVRSRYIGFIFQSYNLVQQYTVTENIQIPLTYQGRGEITAAQQERTMDLARMVGLGDRTDHRPTQLSGSGRDIWLEVDGGVKVDNIAEVARAGADVFVAGSAIFGAARDSDANRYDSVVAALRAELAKA